MIFRPWFLVSIFNTFVGLLGGSKDDFGSCLFSVGIVVSGDCVCPLSQESCRL